MKQVVLANISSGSTYTIEKFYFQGISCFVIHAGTEKGRVMCSALGFPCERARSSENKDCLASCVDLGLPSSEISA